jgi:putative membrane protein
MGAFPRRIAWPCSVGVLLFALFAGAVATAHPGQTRLPPEELAKANVPWLQWDFHPSIFFGILAFTIIYTLGITVWRKRFNLADKVNRRYPICFYSAMVIQWWALDGPLHYLSDERSFLAHMIQHLMLQTIWAPLLVLGIPGWLIRPLVRPAWVQSFGRVLARPRNAWVLFALVLFGWHFPPFYDLALRVHWIHIVEHLMMMVTAVIFWWPIFSPIKEVPRTTYGWQMIYLLVAMAPMKLLGLMIAVQNELIYTFYALQPRVWGLTPVGDQRAGGLMMWILGGLPLWAVLAYVFGQWKKHGTPMKGETGIAALDAKIAKENEA